MNPCSFLLALTLLLSPSVHLLGAAENDSVEDTKQVRVKGSSAQAYVNVAVAAVALKEGAKALAKDFPPTINISDIEDIRPHRFTAIYDESNRVFEHLALWVSTRPESNLSDPFATKVAGQDQKARLFLVIMIRVKYEGFEQWGIHHYTGELPGPRFEAAILELTESKEAIAAADRFCREWSMLPKPAATPDAHLKANPFTNPRWLANVLFVKE